MKQKPTAPKHAKDYPSNTMGSRVAAEARRQTNKLSREERRKLFAGAMVTVYGEPADPKAAGSRH
jgi:hypothetical protein